MKNEKQGLNAWAKGCASQLSCRLCAKHQTPDPKLQRSSKSQTPNLRTRYRGKWRAGRFLSLELGNWELFATSDFCRSIRGNETHFSQDIRNESRASYRRLLLFLTGC